MKDRRITVMFLINHLGIGGAEQQLLELVRGIDKARFRPLVVTLYSDGPLEPEVRQIPGAELISVNRKGNYDFWVITRILSLMRQKKVDIIQPFLTPATFFGLLPALMSHTPVKIVTERSGGQLKARLGHRFYHKMEDFFTRFADLVVANSEAGRHYLIARGINPARIKVIYNGLNLKRLTPDQTKVTQIRNQMRLSPNGIVVGITANFRPDKDYVTFLQAAKIVHQAMPQTRFAILGDGPLRLSIENMVRELGLEPFVTLFGHQRDIASYISCFDVSCLCSKYVEGCSNVTLEAMALGKPVVISDVGGNRELVHHGDTGLLVPCGNAEAAASAILSLIRDLEAAKAMGRKAKERVISQFSLQKMVQQYQSLYDEALRQKEKRRESSKTDQSSSGASLNLSHSRVHRQGGGDTQ